MSSIPSLRRLLTGAVALSVPLMMVSLSAPSKGSKGTERAALQPPAHRDRPMFGGTPERNMVNL
jgi:hypothetical protein